MRGWAASRLLWVPVLAGLVGAPTGVFVASAAYASAVSMPVQDPSPGPTDRSDPSTPLTDVVKYYVVGFAKDGGREYLFQIAAGTLGDGNRYMDIFELNKGRLQPDGQRLEDPLVLQPGWVLILPDDAEGPSVIVGVPPLFGTAQAPPATQAAPPSTSQGDSTPGANGVIAFAVVALALGLGLYLLRRTSRDAAPVLQSATATDVAPAPSQSTRLVPAIPRRRRALLSRSTAEVPVLPTTHATPVIDVVTASPGPVETDAADQLEPPAPRTPVPAQRAVAGGPMSPSPGSLAPMTDPASGRVEAIVHAGPDILNVRLIGARPEPGHAYVWHADPGTRRGQAVIRLGDKEANSLWIDLAASPDVLRITGTRAGVRRLVELLARQLAGLNVSTVAVADVLGLAGVARHAVTSLGEMVDGALPDTLFVVFIGELAATDVPRLHELMGRRRPRVVPVAVGPGPRSRWSIEVA